MAEKLQIVIEGDASNLIAALQKSGVELDRFGGKAKSATPAIAKFVGSLGLGAIAVGAAKGVLELSKIGAESLATARTFENLSGGAYEAAQNLAAMETATRGLASETEQQQIANQLLGMQIADNAGELEQVVGISRRLGKEFRNLGAAEAANEFAIMMSNMSVQRLDSFGISSGNVRARIDELMASTEGMTREQAFFQATMEEANQVMDRLGPEMITTAEAVGGFTAEWQDLLSEIGETVESTGLVSGFFGVVTAGIQDVRQALGGDTAGRIAELTENIARLEGELAEGDAGWFARFTNDTSALTATKQKELDALRQELTLLQKGEEALIRDDAMMRMYARATDTATVSVRAFTGASKDQLDAINDLYAAQDALELARGGFGTGVATAAGQWGIDAFDGVKVGDYETAAESAATAMSSAFDSAFSDLQGVAGGFLSQALGVTGDLGIDTPNIGRQLAEDARRVAAIAAGDLQGEAANLLAAENPDLYKQIMGAGDPMAAAQRWVQDFQQFGIGISQVLDRDAMKQMILSSMQGQSEQDSIVNSIVSELMGTGQYSAAQIQNALAMTGLAPAGGEGAAMDMSAPAQAAIDGFAGSLNELLAEADMMKPFAEAMAVSAAAQNYGPVAAAFWTSFETAMWQSPEAIVFRDGFMGRVADWLASHGLLQSHPRGAQQ